MYYHTYFTRLESAELLTPKSEEYRRALHPHRWHVPRQLDLSSHISWLGNRVDTDSGNKLIFVGVDETFLLCAWNNILLERLHMTSSNWSWGAVGKNDQTSTALVHIPGIDFQVGWLMQTVGPGLRSWLQSSLGWPVIPRDTWSSRYVSRYTHEAFKQNWKIFPSNKTTCCRINILFQWITTKFLWVLINILKQGRISQKGLEMESKKFDDVSSSNRPVPLSLHSQGESDGRQHCSKWCHSESALYVWVGPYFLSVHQEM